MFTVFLSKIQRSFVLALLSKGLKNKKISLCFLVAVAIFLSLVSISFAAKYKITQLTDNNYDDQDPQINSNGYVVWSGYDGSDSEIYLYNGTTTTQLTDNDYPDSEPQINSNGYVVWIGNGNIFLYDGLATTQLTNKSSFYFIIYPQINDENHVVWQARKNFSDYDFEIFLYDGTTTTQLTDNDYEDGYPQINSNGQIAWNGSPLSHGGEIFLYDGTTTTQLTNNNYYDGAPQINSNGYVVWSGYDGSDYEIYLYDGTTISQLTNNDFDDADPKINNNNQIVWQMYDGSDHEIFYAVPDSTEGNLSITISNPNGGESLFKGQDYTITWNSVDVTGNIQIDLYKGGTEPEKNLCNWRPQPKMTGSILLTRQIPLLMVMTIL